MIAHVAEAGEGRGRVVVRLDPARQPSPVALAAAVRVAEAFQSEIESLVVADRQLYELALFPFAAEVSHAGRVAPLSAEALDREIATAAGVLVRAVRAAAVRAGIAVHARFMREEPVLAVARTCAELGPWNVVALAEPLTAADAEALRRLFVSVTGATGVIVTGTAAADTAGPVIVAIEEIDRLPPMLRAAERLAAAGRTETRLVLVSDDPMTLEWMEDQARLVLGDASKVRLEPSLPVRDAAELAERLRRLAGGFVIAQFGGLVVPAGGAARPILSALRCPLFLVR